MKQLKQYWVPALVTLTLLTTVFLLVTRGRGCQLKSTGA